MARGFGSRGIDSVCTMTKVTLNHIRVGISYYHKRVIPDDEVGMAKIRILLMS